MLSFRQWSSLGTCRRNQLFFMTIYRYYFYAGLPTAIFTSQQANPCLFTYESFPQYSNGEDHYTKKGIWKYGISYIRAIVTICDTFHVSYALFCLLRSEKRARKSSSSNINIGFSLSPVFGRPSRAITKQTKNIALEIVNNLYHHRNYAIFVCVGFFLLVIDAFNEPTPFN